MSRPRWSTPTARGSRQAGMEWSMIASLLVSRETRRRYRHGRPRSKQRSSRISKRLRARVMRADRKRCVYCGSRQQPQIDHVIPWIMGGLTWYPNLCVLCKEHNGIKGIYGVGPQGKTYYTPAGGALFEVGRARNIPAAEFGAGLSLARAF